MFCILRAGVIKDLSSDPQIAVLNKDKGKGVVIIDRDVYKSKCKELLTNDKF